MIKNEEYWAGYTEGREDADDDSSGDNFLWGALIGVLVTLVLGGHFL